MTVMDWLGHAGGGDARGKGKSHSRAAAVLAIVGIFAMAALPAGARDEGATNPEPDELAASLPMTLVISLEDQQLRVYRGLEQIATSRVSTGKRGYSTPAGIYSILQKRKWHRSNLYSAAPMPFMQRITWSGIALHAGVVPDHPASHGCIRLPKDFAKELFGQSDIGAHVIVAHTMPTPAPIEHAFLFQSRPSAPFTASADAVSAAAPGSKVVRIATAGKLTKQGPASATNPNGTTSADHPVASYLANLEPDTATSPADQEVAAVSADVRRAPLSKREPVGANPTNLETDTPRRDESKTRSSAPLRILITRRTGREQVMDLQRLLAELGHDPGEIDGYMGSATGAAIQSFQEANGMARTGTLTEDLIAAVFKTAGRSQPAGHIYVRQEYKDIFDAPADIRDPELPLGTHVFTPTDFDEDSGRVDWITIGANPASSSSPAQVLDRIAVTEDARSRIQAILTPGSSLIVSDSGLGRETGKGTDFIVQYD